MPAFNIGGSTIISSPNPAFNAVSVGVDTVALLTGTTVGAFNRDEIIWFPATVSVAPGQTPIMQQLPAITLPRILTQG